MTISSALTTCSTYATCPAEPPPFVPARHQAMAPTIGVALYPKDVPQ